MRSASLALGAAYVMLVGSFAPAQAIADPSGSPAQRVALQSDEQWLASAILSDTGRDAQTTFLSCVSEAILRDPSSGLAGQERTRPGITDYVIGDITGQLRTGFAPKWFAAQAALAARLVHYPANERAAVRAFFESPTGIKFLGALNAKLAELSPPFDHARGMDQCRRSPPAFATFEAQMTVEDRRRFAQFPANPGAHLTPGSSLELGAQIGGNAATAYFAEFGNTAGPMISRASAAFAAAHKANGAH